MCVAVRCSVLQCVAVHQYGLNPILCVVSLNAAFVNRVVDVDDVKFVICR